MQLRRWIMPLSFLALAGLRAEAGLIVFTDRAAWEAAAPGFVTEDFETTPALTPLPANVINHLGLVDFSYTGTARPTTPSLNDSGFVNGSRELSGHIFDLPSGGGV